MRPSLDKKERTSRSGGCNPGLLAALGIIGIKEAMDSIERAQWLIRDVPKGFAVYSGDTAASAVCTC